MSLTDEALEQLLVPPGHISADDFRRALEESRSEKQPLADVLIARDLIKDEQLGALTADAAGLPFLDLGREKIDQAVFQTIPETLARARGVVAVDRTAALVRLGMVDPTDAALTYLMEQKFGLPVKAYYVTSRGLNQALSDYGAGVGAEIKPLAERLAAGDLTADERNAALVKLVDTILHYGAQAKASDIHLEPSGHGFLIRFRIDGVLHDMLTVPRTLVEPIVTRIKILAKLRIDEHLSAQDGKLQFLIFGRPTDVRVSIVPVTEGENVVLRILSEESRRFSLSDLGLGPADFERVKRAIDNPHGLILVTGPTGSGKTTTVYSVIKILNKRDVHIATIEDPVEYEIEGVSQIQVNPKTNLTFAAGLRSIVRQDPDIIVVGEIRDEETAGIAVNSAMTGHLVISTLHANDAPTTLPRLLDMGIEPFLIASTVNAIIAERLVRKICEKCRASAEITKQELLLINNESRAATILKRIGPKKLNTLTLYRGAGCKVCNSTGFVGRIGIFEVLTLDDAIRSLIVKRAPSGEILEAAEAAGMTTMLEDGLGKVLAGVTTLEEVIRIIKI